MWAQLELWTNVITKLHSIIQGQLFGLYYITQFWQWYLSVGFMVKEKSLLFCQNNTPGKQWCPSNASPKSKCNEIESQIDKSKGSNFNAGKMDQTGSKQTRWMQTCATLQMHSTWNLEIGSLLPILTIFLHKIPRLATKLSSHILHGNIMEWTILHFEMTTLEVLRF